MSYRDELEASRAHIQTLERELAWEQQRRREAEQSLEERESEKTAASSQIAPPAPASHRA